MKHAELQAIDWQSLCRPGTSKASALRRPFLVDGEGATWTAATDGCGILLVRGKLRGARYTGPATTWSAVVEESSPLVHRVAWSELSSWCREAEQRVSCAECDGTGELTSAAPRECYACDGQGTWTEADFQRAPNGGCFDRVLLWRFLRTVYAPSVRIGSCEGWEQPMAIVPDSDEWRVYIMPGRLPPGDSPQGAFPLAILEAV